MVAGLMFAGVVAGTVAGGSSLAMGSGFGEAVLLYSGVGFATFLCLALMIHAAIATRKLLAPVVGASQETKRPAMAIQGISARS